ncbi:hypothetical protein [Xylanimonas allomyrinae]|uniref:hypothetical protein n=1 Tax=Xylanimonas allomyrinae TaxID=2509459 RepID=UPI001FE411A6|nr:hypothetical protein [Xylanimonas allomyrinae]
MAESRRRRVRGACRSVGSGRGSSRRVASREPDPARGLTAAQVAQRVADGRANDTAQLPSRTFGQIVRANVLTPFNALLVGLFGVVLATGRWQNGLFVGVVVANSVVGIVQEIRAKRTLDRLAMLTTPTARTVRDGVVAAGPVEAVVLDDLLELRAGDQVPRTAWCA